jgi:hypothetical protein
MGLSAAHASRASRDRVENAPDNRGEHLLERVGESDQSRARERLGRVARSEDRARRGALQILGEREHHDGNALGIRALAKKLISEAIVALVQSERRDPLVDLALDTTASFGTRHG